MILKRLFLFLFICCPRIFAAQGNDIHLVTFDYPPFMVNENGSTSGMNVDIVRAVFDRMELSVQIDFYPVSRCLKMMEKSETDGMFSLKKTPDRERSMVFPEQALLLQDYVFFKLKNTDVTFVGDLLSLIGNSIGVVDNTSYGPLFDKAVKEKVLTKIDSSSSFELTFKKLIAGRMDVVLCSRIVGLSIIKTLGYENEIVIIGPPVETVPSYLSFSRKANARQLAERFDKAMLEITDDGTLELIIVKYK